MKSICRKVWDALTGDVLHSFEHKHIVRACAFSEVGSSIIIIELEFYLSARSIQKMLISISKILSAMLVSCFKLNVICDVYISLYSKSYPLEVAICLTFEFEMFSYCGWCYPGVRGDF